MASTANPASAMTADKSAWAIDADGHVLEPPWALPDYIDPKFRDRAPRIVEREGHEYWEGDAWLRYTATAVGSSLATPATALPGCAGIMRWNQSEYSGRTMPPYSKANPAAFHPGPRLQVMDQERFEAAFLYPTLGLTYIPDVEYACALNRAYNDWLADYCKAEPRRLYGIAAVTLADVDAAVAELRRCVKTHGFKGVFLRPCLYRAGTNWWDAIYDPFWSACEELDVPVGFHPFSVDRMPGAGAYFGLDQNQPVQSFMRAPFVHPVDSMFVTGSLICGGVLQRHPGLRVGILEASGGWIVPYLERLDHRFEHLGHTLPDNMKMKPSDYFRRQCWISFDPEEVTLELTARVIGAERILIGSDFPHPDAFYPNFVDLLLQVVHNLSAQEQQQILSGAARSFYKV
jgi:predicted TIM-barrel fold metal-dependent hydrolase